MHEHQADPLGIRNNPGLFFAAFDSTIRRFIEDPSKETIDLCGDMLEEFAQMESWQVPHWRAQWVARRFLHDACRAWFDGVGGNGPRLLSAGGVLEHALEGSPRVFAGTDECEPIGPILAGVLLDLAWPIQVASGTCSPTALKTCTDPTNQEDRKTMYLQAKPERSFEIIGDFDDQGILYVGCEYVGAEPVTVRIMSRSCPARLVLETDSVIEVVTLGNGQIHLACEQ